MTILKETVPPVKTALIVDDILDTGASLRASKELLPLLNVELVGAFYLLNSYGELANEDFGLSVKALHSRQLFT